MLEHRSKDLFCCVTPPEENWHNKTLEKTLKLLLPIHRLTLYDV